MKLIFSRMKHKAITIILTLFSLISFPALAQKNIETQQLLWMRYSLKLKINPTYQIRQEFEERIYWFPWRQHQFVSRTQLDRKLGNGWNVALGFTYLLQALPQDPLVKDFETNTELRPQFEIANNQKLGSGFSLNHRYWTEFRFLEQPDGSFEYNNIRTRYKLELSYTPFKKTTLKAFDEIQLNIGSKIVNNVFDQNRYGASFQFMAKENLGFELGYINWFQQRKSGADFYSRDIIRFTIHQSLNLKRPKS